MKLKLTFDPNKTGKQESAVPAKPKRNKHTPATPKGTHFKWADNDTLVINPFKLNEPQKNLSMILKDTTGKVYTYKYPGKITDWSSKNQVFKANQWYNQYIARKLNRPNPDESRATRHRPQWSKQEKVYLESLITKKVRATKRKPTLDDWEEIAEDQNNRFVGQTVKAGQGLVENNETSKSKAGKPSRKRLITKKAFDIPSRTSFAIVSVIRKWSDTTAMINELLDEVGYYDCEQSGDETEQEDGQDEADGIQAGFKDEDESSDDEMNLDV